ncbi:MAG: TonB family protein [Bacteroidaceae bacterium]|nr:TonB family protein [Bacteroidaceae bacterium]
MSTLFFSLSANAQDSNNQNANKVEIIEIIEDDNEIVEDVLDGDWVDIDIRDKVVVTQDTVYEVVDQMPEFPGGDAALMQFINKHIVYPSLSKEYGIEGRVMVSFVVETDGSLSDVKVTKSLEMLLDEVARGIISQMPQWKPGIQAGKPVRVLYNLPINFRLNKNDSPSEPAVPDARKHIQVASFTSLVSRYTGGNKEVASPLVSDDPADVNNKCISITTTRSPRSAGDTQLMLYLEKPFTLGDTLCFSLKAKGVSKQKISTEFHTAPGSRLKVDPFEAFEITKDWQEFSFKYVMDNSIARTQTIVLNLADKGSSNVCFFDDMKVEIHHVRVDNPEFPGGVAAIKEYLKANNKYPSPGRGKSVYVNVHCMIDTDGSISDVRQMSSVDSLLDAEAIRLVQGMPKWIPGKRNGEPFRQNRRILVEFDNTNVDWEKWAKENNGDGLFMVVEDMPEFPGGASALLEFLRSNVKYPRYCQEMGIQGRVLVEFVVDRDGTVLSPEVVKGVHPQLDQEALRIMSIMPKWKPGQQRGKPVRVKYTVPVNFRLN